MIEKRDMIEVSLGDFVLATAGAALGAFFGAVVTPTMTRRIGIGPWVGIVMVQGGVVGFGLLTATAINPQLVTLVAGAASIGLRPEHVVQGEGEESFVNRVEHLGDQTRLHLVYKNHDLVTVTDAHTTLTHGDMVKIQPRNPLYFDASGARLA